MIKTGDPQLKLGEAPTFDVYSPLRIILVLLALLGFVAALSMPKLPIEQGELLAPWILGGAVLCLFFVSKLKMARRQISIQGNEVRITGTKKRKDLFLENSCLTSGILQAMELKLPLSVQFLPKHPGNEAYLSIVRTRIQELGLKDHWIGCRIVLVESRLALHFHHATKYSKSWAVIASLDPDPTVTEVDFRHFLKGVWTQKDVREKTFITKYGRWIFAALFLAQLLNSLFILFKKH
jgi:hypothetical protein